MVTPRTAAYFYAAAFVAAGAVARLGLSPILHNQGTFLMFIFAVAGAAWKGGLRPGLLAMTVSVFAAAALFIHENSGTTIANRHNIVYLSLFIAESVVVCLLAESAHKANRQRWAALQAEREAREHLEAAARAANEEIERRRSAESELRRSNEDLERFAIVISHDIQEPLRSIRSQTLSIAKAQSTPANGVDNMVERIDSLLRLVSDILTYSRSTRYSAVSNLPVSLEDVLNWTRTNLDAKIREQSATITAGALPSIYADFGALSQVFQNLLDNAIKYHGSSPPEIRVSARQESNFCIVSVEDNGIGIDTALAGSVFTAFTRLHGSEIPGSGIGLSTCRRIIESLGGRIWVEPGESKGSLFRFSIPLDLVLEGGPANNPTPKSRTSVVA